MANRKLVTLLGSLVISNDMVVAQSGNILVGTMVESLVMEFDQEKYEDFLSSGSISPKSLQKYRKVQINLASNEAIQGNLPKDSLELTNLKEYETSSCQAQGSGFVSLKTLGDLMEMDQNPCNNKGK